MKHSLLPRILPATPVAAPRASRIKTHAPTVSIIMPCWNAAATIGHAIRSVQAQNFPDWELLIADDCSTDASVQSAINFAIYDKRIKIVFGDPNAKGAAHARNRALQNAKGRYIAFLDADDHWLPHKLEVQISQMQKNRWPISFTGYVIRRRHRKDKPIAAPEKLTHVDLLRGNKIGCLTVVYDREFLGKCPMPTMARRHDYALWLDILKTTQFAYGIPAPLAVHVRSKSSLSANAFKSTLGTWRMLRSHAGLNRAQSLRTLCLHLGHRLLWR